MSKDPDREAASRDFADRPQGHGARPLIPRKPCANCRKRPATTKWLGDLGGLAEPHGLYHWWCDVCVIERQLIHARERAAAIPALERALRLAHEAATV